jgi:hypothetical protein
MVPVNTIRHALAGLLLAGCLAGAGCRTVSPPAAPSASPSSPAQASIAPSSSPAVSVSGAPAASPTPLASEHFSVEKDSLPQEMGAHYVWRWTRYPPGGKPVSYTADDRLSSKDNDLLAYTESTTVDGKPGPGIRFFAITRDDAIYLDWTEPPLETGKKTHSLSGASLMFKFPMRPGDQWTYTTPQKTPASRKVLGMEQVKVPAGTYNAVVLQETRQGATGKSWYVPGIGVVRSEIVSAAFREVKELQKFEAASKSP